ncbi:MAG: 16S rRNA (guanine(527)-N(7))-methyltransferase RsmG [Sulfitobacter sp.]
MTAYDEANVSRETSDMLSAYVDLVKKWTPKINLISKGSIEDIWSRHINDSAQIFELAPRSGHWVDLGSGGGFPGIVVSILSKSSGAAHTFTLVESDQRKCAFLRTAARELGLDIAIKAERVESLDPLDADILTARALAELPVLLRFAERHLSSNGIAIFPKGATWQKEHSAAQAVWSYRCEAVTSTTNAAAAVLKIQEITRV